MGMVLGSEREILTIAPFFWAELLAIEEALKFCFIESVNTDIWIFSDSHSSLQHLYEWWKHGDRTTASIIQLLNSSSANALKWTYSSSTACGESLKFTLPVQITMSPKPLLPTPWLVLVAIRASGIQVLLQFFIVKPFIYRRSLAFPDVGEGGGLFQHLRKFQTVFSLCPLYGLGMVAVGLLTLELHLVRGWSRGFLAVTKVAGEMLNDKGLAIF
ncbi:uncharacterized protein TNCV_3972241 [Trichonephila clavipes]|nr:uncharacterized protein TNCV_3972241 [Trichonephila clavipes]